PIVGTYDVYFATSQGTAITVKAIVTQVEIPDINKVTPGVDSTICGEGIVNNTILITYPDGSQQTVTVAHDGTWCTISPIKLIPGDTVTAEQIDVVTGDVSDDAQTIVIPEVPSVQPI